MGERGLNWFGDNGIRQWRVLRRISKNASTRSMSMGTIIPNSWDNVEILVTWHHEEKLVVLKIRENGNT